MALSRALRIGVPVVAALVLFAVMLRLGFWQLERAGFKDALEQRFASSAGAVPQPPAQLLATAPDELWQFRPTRVSGTPDVARQYLLDNRTLDGKAGYHVLLAVAVAGGSILVNRGWVAVGADRSVLPDVAMSAQPREFAGLLVSPPRGGLLLGAAGYDAAGWPKVVQQLDLVRIEAQLGRRLLPAVILLDPRDGACFACDWKPVVGVSADRHRGYALQWFALAAALAVIVLVVTLKWNRGRAS